jgi:hypothetical protein
MSKVTMLAEFYQFLMARKKWWLMVIVVFLVLFGALIMLTEGSALSAFIYTLF